MHDAMIVSALKRLLDKHVHFRKRVSVEEQRAQKYNRFLRGRQIAWMIYEHSRATGKDQICSIYVCRVTPSKISTFDGMRLYYQQADVILEGLYTSKIEGLCSAPDCLGLVWTRNRSKQWTDKFFTIEDVCKTSYWSDDEHSKLQSLERSCGKRISIQEFKKERKPTLRGKCESVFSGMHMDNVQKETHSCSFSHDKLVQGDMCGGQRRKGRSSSPAPNTKAKTDEWEKKTSKKHQETETKALQTKRRELVKTCKNPSWKCWHRPVCYNFKFEIGCTFGRTCFFREADEKPSKKVKEGWYERISCIIEGVFLVGLCISRFLSERVFSAWKRTLGIKTRVKFSKGNLAPSENSGKKVSIARIPKCAPHERGPCAPKFEERSHEETLHQEGCARSAAWDLANILTSTRMRTKLRSFLLWS